MIRFTLLLLLGLAACAPQAGTLVSRDTGLIGSYTRQVVISADPHYVLMGHLIDVHRDGEQVRALVIGQRRDGVNRFFAREAWSGDTRLPYRAMARRSDGCTHGHCRDHAVGNIYLSEAIFAHASQHGLSARLTGYSGAIDIRVPATLFQSVPAL